uniref:Reverse transcriptase domain-containing protein n=1 Tax=Tanacetum cinerariifolium TaxID=118510 RepID=A0A6L2P310_TANCI|nr:reverse transcriptase domain-containing protein [Tanacetum cinerariifolium]
MRARNSYYQSNSSVTIPRRQNKRRAPNVVELELRTIVVAPMVDNRTMEELLQAPKEGYGEAIVIPEINADHFEFKTNLLQLVQANPYHGFERENTHIHINNFKRITSTLKFRDVPNDVIKLMMFSYSSRKPLEFELTQIYTFYNGLNKNDQDSLNAAARGNLMSKTTREAFHIIKNKSKVRYSRYKPNVSRMNTTFRENSSKTGDRIDKPAYQISTLAEIVSKKVITLATVKAVEESYVTCVGNHACYNCDATNSNQSSVCAATGTYNQVVPQNRGQPYGTTRFCSGSFSKQEENLRKNSNGDMTSILGGFFQNQASTLGTLPSNTIPNPNGKMKAITTRSGVAYEGPSIPTNPSPKKVVEQEIEETTDKEQTDFQGSTTHIQPPVTSIPEHDVPKTLPKPNIPYPSRLNDQKLREKATNQMEKEEYAQEMLGFSNNSSGDNPTSNFEPIISDSFPSLTPFKGNLKQGEVAKEKSSIEEPSELELKDLPSHLEYAYLEGVDKLLVIIVKYLKDDEKESLLKVLKSHKRAIAWKITDIKGIDPRFCTHKILMEEDSKPMVQSQRRVNLKIHEVIKKEVIKLLDAGMIDSIFDSPWVSPIHCVSKKDGITVVENEKNELIPTRLVTGWRVCIDYQKLNDATRKDHFPLLFMDQMLERLAGNEFYCFLDGFFGYFQIPINPPDQEKTTFTCPYGTFAYRRMPFGLCNDLGTFQWCMLSIFHDMIEKPMEVFMDDFSVFGDSFSSCLSHLDTMLQRCEDTNLVLNWEKCHFMVKEGIVLGHKISKNGLEVDRAKVDVIAKLPHLTTIKGLRSFLGYAGFYRRFIQDFSKIARPTTHLLEKETPFVFSKDCINAFETLKKKLTEGPILVVPDWNPPFELMCDASDFAIGVGLGQRKTKHFQPIHYASKTMTKA